MAMFRYRALDTRGETVIATVEASTLYDATEQIRSTEAKLVSIERIEDRPRRFEPDGRPPGSAPRDLPRGVTGMPGGTVVFLVGGIFMAVAAVFVIVGVGLVLGGNTEGVFFALFPLIHLAVGAGLVGFARRRRNMRRRLYREGRAVIATVDATDYDQSVRINGRHPYELRWSFDLLDKWYQGKRSTTNEAVTVHERGDRIWVLYDPDDPTKSVEWPPL